MNDIFSVKSIYLILVFFSFSHLVNAQDSMNKGYTIDITVKDMPNTSFLLAYYFNESTYVKDSTISDESGNFVFSGPERLDPGVYMLVLGKEKQKLFDFPIHGNQTVILKTESKNPYALMEVVKDEESKLFFSNLMFNSTQGQKARDLQAIISDEESTEENKNEARNKLKTLNSEMQDFQKNLIEEYPETLIAKVLNARKPIDVPQYDPENGIDSTYQYHYFKSHYWDNIDLTEPGLLRLPFPLLNEKIDEYLDKVIVQNPDTLIKAIDKMISMSKSNKEMYRYITWTIATKYYAPDIMGLDKVFVHISDNYFSSGEMDFWIDDQLKSNITDRASKLRLSMLGMKAPNLIMQDVEGKPQSMYNIKTDYTLLYFYDPDCGHCKKETPILVDFMNSSSREIQAYTICADTSLTKMKNYIDMMEMESFVNVNGPRTYVGPYSELYDAFQTPTIYLLNEKKEIIAKKLPADKLGDFLDRYEAVLRKKED